jgi:hypothetical protein
VSDVFGDGEVRPKLSLGAASLMMKTDRDY